MKKMILTLMCCLLVIPSSFANLPVPNEVAPLMHKNIEYRAPFEKMGYIQARDIKTNKILWEKRIYSVSRDTLLEEDMKWICITSLTIKDNKLIIRNEANKQYALDLNTKEVHWIIPEGMEIFSTNLTITLAIQKANEYSELKGFILDEYIIVSAEYDWDRKKWVIFYEGKAPSPGNHFLIYIDDKTEDIKLMRGK